MIGRCAPTTGIDPVRRAGRAGDDHRALRLGAAGCSGSWTTAPRTTAPAPSQRMQAAWPTAVLVHLPIHASWLNQIEIFFSIVQRKVIKPQDFADLDALADRLAGLRRPLQRHRRALRLALHPPVPRPAPRTAHPPRAAGGMTPDVPTETTTSAAALSWTAIGQWAARETGRTTLDEGTAPVLPGAVRGGSRCASHEVCLMTGPVARRRGDGTPTSPLPPVSRQAKAAAPGNAPPQPTCDIPAGRRDELPAHPRPQLNST